MESTSQVSVPLRTGGKKMRKRRELDALVAHSLAKRKQNVGKGINSQDQLLSPSTDEQDDLVLTKSIRGSSRIRNRKFPVLRFCGPLICLLSIFMSLGFMYWLYFDLRQQLYEYHQRIEEVSITSQNLPEALQKWHETKKFLEQNQTAIYGRLADIQHNLENLSADYLSYKEKIKEKNDYSRDQKFVADFGAKIEAINVDVEGLKSHFSELQKSLASSQDEMANLKNNFSEMINNTKFPSTYEADANNCTKEIKNLEQITLDKIKAVAFNLSLINDTSSQDTKHIYEALERQKKDLEQLGENCLNMTTHIKSIEGCCETDSERTVTIKRMEENYKQEIQELRNETAQLRNMIQERVHQQQSFFLDNLNQKDYSQNGKKTNPTAPGAVDSSEKPIRRKIYSNPSIKESNDPLLALSLPSTKIPISTATTTTSTSEAITKLLPARK